MANPGPYSTHTFVFDHVYDQSSSQKKVFETTARGVVDSALQGYNATIFAYGQTGTGNIFQLYFIFDGRNIFVNSECHCRQNIYNVGEVKGRFSSGVDIYFLLICSQGRLQ